MPPSTASRDDRRGQDEDRLQVQPADSKTTASELSALGSFRLLRFPAVDSEPPAHSRRHWPALAVAAVVAAALVAFTANWLAAAPKPPSPPGRVASVTQQSTVVLSDADGTHVTTVAGVNVRGGALPAASPDGRYLVLDDGTILAGNDGRLDVHPTPLEVSARTAIPFSPFADRDRAVVTLTEGRFGGRTTTAGVSVTNLVSGQVTSLGVADYAAGDPRQIGAFVSVAASQTASGVIPTGDTTVELRDASVPPLVIATAASLSAILGQQPAQAVTLVPYPDPQGDKVAVVISSASGGGIVVVDRSGQVVASTDIPATANPAWSPNGASLAYPIAGPNGPQIAVWAIGTQRPATRPVAYATGSLGAIVCDPPKGLGCWRPSTLNRTPNRRLDQPGTSSPANTVGQSRWPPQASRPCGYHQRPPAREAPNIRFPGMIGVCRRD